MPFAAPSFLENEENKKQGGGQFNVSGQSTSFSTGVPGQQGAAKPQKGSGSKFANIQSYLSANQDQGNQMGGQIASQVDADASDATNKINSIKQQAPQVKAYDPNEAYKNVTSLNDQQKQDYNQAKAGYKGPNQLGDVQGFSDAQSSFNKASSQVANVGTEQGQQALLKQTYRRPSYTGGENALDQTIIQNSSGSRKGFEDLKSKYSGLNNLFDTTANDLGNAINTSKTTALNNQKAIASGEEKAMADLMDPIRARAQAQTGDNARRASAIQADIADEILSQDTLDALGLNVGQKLYNLDLSNYLTPDQTQVGVNNAATNDERQKYAALTALINGTAGNEITADGQAINPYSFDKDRLDKDIASKDAEFEKFKNTYSGGYLDFLAKNNLATRWGLPTGGAFWNRINGMNMNQLQNELTGLQAPGYQRDYDQDFLVQTIPQYMSYLQNQFGANRRIQKG